MAGKRQATTDLNHDNWDHDEEPEERGTFKTANVDELRARVIKRATRRKTNAGPSEGADDANAGPSKSVFSGFAGFGSVATANTVTSSNIPKPFSFLSKMPGTPPVSSDAGSTDKSSIPPAKQFSFQLNNDQSSGRSNTLNRTSFTPTTSIFGKPLAPEATNTPKTTSLPSENQHNDNKTMEFHDNVADLNRSVVKFMKEHIDKNAYCILTPVFDSYEKHMKELREKYAGDLKEPKGLTKAKEKATIDVPKRVVDNSSPKFATTKATTLATNTSATTSTPLPNSGFFFGNPTEGSAPSSIFGKKPNCTVTSGGSTTTVTAPTFSFGNVPPKSDVTSNAITGAGLFSFAPNRTTPTSDAQPKPNFFGFGTSNVDSGTLPPKTNGFSFGTFNDDKPSTSGFGTSTLGKTALDSKQPPSSGFSFASAAAPFSFGNAKPPTAASTGDNAADAENDEEDKPPKVVFKQVVEADASFSKRCKVYVKKNNDYADRGVGTLYLKPVKDSNKTQMLVRADTNLGNILINVLLSKGLPCHRTGKNNVMMMCIPTPEAGNVTTILLRVKTAEEADELFEKIKKHMV